MAQDDRTPQDGDNEADAYEGDGYREYVAQIDPGTATEMEAVLENLERMGEQPADGLPPDLPAGS